MQKLHIILLCNLATLLCSLVLSAQNLLVNPGFEDINICCEKSAPCSPEGWFGFDLAENSPTIVALNPEKRIRFQTPHTVLINMGGPGMDRATYCAFTPLLTPLTAGKKYRLTVHVLPHLITVNQIQVAFTDTVFPIFSTSSILLLKPTWRKYIRKGKKWVELSLTVEAKGHEKYLFIGLLNPAIKTKYKSLNGGKGESSFYLDDVSLIGDSVEVDTVILSKNHHLIYAENRRHDYSKACYQSGNLFPFLLHEQISDSNTTLHNLLAKTKWIDFNADGMDHKLFVYRINYENDTAVAYDSYTKLDFIVKKMLTDTSLRIVLRAHLDASYRNKSIPLFEVGLMQAQAVKKYLIRQGIQPSRIRAESSGSMHPIGNRNYEQASLLNTRLEIEWLK